MRFRYEPLIQVEQTSQRGNGLNKNRKSTKRFAECPLTYPKGWLPVLESNELSGRQIKSVFGFGNDLIAFRDSSGKICVLDAFCPHLGADLSVGGTVSEDHIRCPFHGWVFDTEGKCVTAPGVKKSNRAKVAIKVWNSLEVNGFVFVWNLKSKPNWIPKSVTQILDQGYSLKGKCEHLANCHIQEIVENGADLMHFSEIHLDNELFGGTINNKDSLLHKCFGHLMRFDWKTKWSTSDQKDEKHISKLELTFTRSLFSLTIMKVTALVRQIGPAHLTMRVDIHCVGTVTIYVIQSLISHDLFQHRYIHHFYTKTSLKDWLFLKYSTLAMKIMVERDLMILNNKKFLKTPFLARNESTLKAFRRWYSQFYDESEQPL